MKLSYQWLCEILPGLKDQLTPEEAGQKLTMSGLEIESIETLAGKYQGIVVGKVVSVEKHPNADKLSLCRVSTGKEEFQVVCGAKNVAADSLFPFATLGTKMPDGLEIKPVKLRGVESHGMLCSGKELEFSFGGGGILLLDSQLNVGEPIAQALGLDDVILELNITANRGDALSHWGVARELAALTGLKPDFSILFPKDSDLSLGLAQKNQAADSELSLKIKVDDDQGCPRYTGSELFGVQVGQSPLWLATRLETLGVRSINNVVDATNYIMLLTGHPVHAFDANTVSKNEIQIYSLSKDSKFTTLDDEERDLLAGDLVIADADKPVALAGVMGGQNSEVATETQNLILEVAFFDPDGIRKTARRLGLQSESSYRFERFVNPDSVKEAHQLLQDLILALAGGNAGAIQDHYSNPYEKKAIGLELSEIKRILGCEIPEADIERILTGLQCELNKRDGGYDVLSPIFRSDLQSDIDLIEEVARIWGLDNIPAVLPALMLRLSKEDKGSTLEREIKNFFVSQGFHETVHYSFADQKLLDRILDEGKESAWIRLQNPISEDLSVMRPSLLPQMANTYQQNHLQQEEGLSFFELRNVYDQNAESSQRKVLAGLYGGDIWGRNRFSLERRRDFFDGKGLMDLFFSNARISAVAEKSADYPYHPGQSLTWKAGDRVLGRLGCLHPLFLQGFKIKTPLYAFEIDYEVLADLYQSQTIAYQRISDLPPVYRDLALLVPKELPQSEIIRVIDEERPETLKEVSLFDLYEGEKLPDGKKSLAYSLIYEPVGQSLSDEEVNAMHFGLVDRLKERLGVELR